jgi:hypothetical protein
MGYRWGPLDLVAHRLSWRRCAGGKPSQGCKTERVYCVELVCTSVWVDLCVRLDVVGVVLVTCFFRACKAKKAQRADKARCSPRDCSRALTVTYN